jgi:hypothetical protein
MFNIIATLYGSLIHRTGYGQKIRKFLFVYFSPGNSKSTSSKPDLAIAVKSDFFWSTI